MIPYLSLSFLVVIFSELLIQDTNEHSIDNIFVVVQHTAPHATLLFLCSL
jgi:hypothetical protein